MAKKKKKTILVTSKEDKAEVEVKEEKKEKPAKPDKIKGMYSWD